MIKEEKATENDWALEKAGEMSQRITGYRTDSNGRGNKNTTKIKKKEDIVLKSLEFRRKKNEMKSNYKMSSLFL